MSVPSSSLGFPRIGAARELKKAQESYWSKKTSAQELLATATRLRRDHWLRMKTAGLSQVPSNDFSLYDHVLDAAVSFSAVPARYQVITDPLERYFAMARGLQDAKAGVDIPALEMTKWFDTNYHYIVPELEAGQAFTLDASRLLNELEEAIAVGVEPRPVIIGPVSFLLLSKMSPGTSESVTSLDSLDALLPLYEQLLSEVAARGVQWAQIDEPCLTLDLLPRTREAYRHSFRTLGGNKGRPHLLLATYFGALEDNLSLALESGFEGLHVDLVRAPEQLEAVLRDLPDPMRLSLGLVDGRNIWRTDLHAAHLMIRRAVASIGLDRILLAPSCSLLHVPVDLGAEERLDPEVKHWLAFATQKLEEVVALAQSAGLAEPSHRLFAASAAALKERRGSTRVRNAAVRSRILQIDEGMLRRKSAFPERVRVQHARFKLPPFPTTTIGSFPQTSDVRGARAAWRAGRMSSNEYDSFLKAETQRCIERQETLGLDVLVHGELERNDMVEYFGEQLEGFAFTQNGWVQSYGSRCVKPPVLFGDVARPKAMTVEWSAYAKSLSQRPLKGMLTGPVTILQWSFVRDDQSRAETCRQIALALRDEVADLESAGISMIQVDEPAIREGLPLRHKEWKPYLRWAVDAFRLATSVVRDDTQVHTHMCYSEFGDILDSIAELDADVLSIETSRSKMELLLDFARFRYPNEIGPGVYDIHSPRVPTPDEMVGLMERAKQVLPNHRLWMNPDCGLKTRGWREVEQALANMVEAAKVMRSRVDR